MSACAVAAIALSTAGGTAELLGLFMVWREIASDRQRGRRLLRDLETRQPPRRRYPPPTSGSSPLTPQWASSVYGSERQISGIVGRIQGLEASVGNALIALKKGTDAELDRAIGGLEQEMARRDADLRDGLRYVLAGSTRERTIGAVLVGVGIVLAAAGSVLGTLA